MSRVFYTKPSLSNLEFEYVNDAVQFGWGDNCYKYIEKFELMFAEHIGAPYAIATSSCTGALHMGLAALGVGAGDEVILADTNWIATVAPIVHLGAKPIFVDILEESWCLDPTLVELAVSDKTKAIIATHLYGNLCEMGLLREIADKHNIYLIEDAAEAIGSVFEGKRAGSLGDFSCFSFHGSKTITTGEGGMFITHDKDLFENVLTLSNHGRSRKQLKQFFPDVIGYKNKISNVQAAIGCGQLERVDELIERKREIFSFYKESFKNIDYLTLNFERKNCSIGAWMPNVVFSRDSNILGLRAKDSLTYNNIDARVFFYPLSTLPMFKEAKINKMSFDIHERSINLPSFHDITEEELHKVIKVVKGLIK